MPCSPRQDSAWTSATLSTRCADTADLVLATANRAGVTDLLTGPVLTDDAGSTRPAGGSW